MTETPLNENITYPRALLQCAESPSMRNSDREHQMNPRNNQIQKYTSGKTSLKICLSLVELLDMLFQRKNTLLDSAEARRGGRSETAEWKAGQQPLLTRHNTNTQDCLVDTCGNSVFLEASAPKRKADVCLRSPFIHALQGGVRVAKHARQL